MLFQVFVANPKKPQPIIDILTNNKDKLLKYLEDFHTDKGEAQGCNTSNRSCIGSWHALNWLMTIVLPSLLLAARWLFSL